MNVMNPFADRLARIRAVCEAVNFRPALLLAPLLFSLLGSVCEGAGVVLLVPVLKLFTENETAALRQYWLLDRLWEYLPSIDKSAMIAALLFSIGMLALGRIFSQFASSYLLTKLMRRLSNSLRKALYGRYMSFGKLYFDTRNIGQLQQTLTVYVDLVAREIAALNNAANSGLVLMVYFVVMCSISPVLTLLTAIVFPVLHFGLRHIISKIRASSLVLRQFYGAMGKKISNSLLCIPLVHAYANEKGEQAWFDSISDEVTATQLKIDLNNLLVPVVKELIMLGVLAGGVLALLLGSSMGFKLEFESGLVFLFTIKRSSSHLGSLNVMRAHFATVSGQLKEIIEVFEDEGKFKISQGQIRCEGLEREIRISNLDFSYPGKEAALSGISLVIRRGEKVALVGESGAGKTTIVNLLMRHYECPPGTIMVDGMDVRDLTLESWRSQIAEVSQNHYILNATFESNLVYGLRQTPTKEDLSDALRKAGLSELVAGLPAGLDTQIGDMGINLSGGEKQRLSIARAILKRSQILILDEATSSLDSLTERAIRDALEELSYGKTVIIVAHRLSTISGVDQIFVVEGGKIVETGSPRDLIQKKGRFFAYWVQQDISSHH